MITPEAGPGTGVAHVIAPADFGGAESVVRYMCEGRHAAGKRTMAVLLLQHDHPSPLGTALRQAGVEVEEVRCGRRHYGREARAVEGVARAWGADILHSHVYHADFITLLAARRYAVPLVSTVHGFTGGDAKNRFFEWLDRRVLRHFDRIICVAEPQVSILTKAGVPAARIRVIKNGILPPAFMDRAAARASLGVPADAQLIGWVGRFSPEKGPDQFVRVMQEIGHPSLVGVMIGDGSERTILEHSIATGGARIMMLGRVPNAARMLRAFDVVALTSRTEGTPMVVLEAMAAGVPTACFRVGGVSDVVDDATSWLADSGDIGGLASAIRAALENPSEAERRAANASARFARDFSVDRWLASVEAVYDEVRPV